MFERDIADANKLKVQEELNPLPAEAIQSQVTGTVLYPLSGADGVPLDVFPKAKEIIMLNNQKFLSTYTSASKLVDMELIDSLFLKNPKLGSIPKSFFFLPRPGQRALPMTTGYDFSDIFLALSTMYDISLPVATKEIFKIGISSLLLARIRACYGATINSVEVKAEGQVYSINILHKGINKTIHYVQCNLGYHSYWSSNDNTISQPGYRWVVNHGKIDAVLFKGYPMQEVMYSLGIKMDKNQVKRQIDHILTLIAPFANSSLVVVSDGMLDRNPLSSLFNPLGALLPPLVKILENDAPYKRVQLPGNTTLEDMRLFGYGPFVFITNATCFDVNDSHLNEHSRIKMLCGTAAVKTSLQSTVPLKKEDNYFFKIIVAASVVTAMLAAIVSMYYSQYREREI